MRSQLDTLIQNLTPKVLLFLNWVFAISAAITLIEWLDIGLRIITGTITIGVGLLSWRHYSLKNRLIEKEIELKDQQIHAQMVENKRRTDE